MSASLVFGGRGIGLYDIYLFTGIGKSKLWCGYSESVQGYLFAK